MNVQEEIMGLRRDGFIVRVHHVRTYRNLAAQTLDGLDFHLTKGQFQRAAEDNQLFYVAGDNVFVAENEELIYGKQVSPTGGFTTVTIEREGFVVSRGKRNFNNEPFNKRIGLIAAFGRAYKQLTED